ncbi:BrnT family toxin [Lonepinella sp. BR2271]|uniref:BrnT family toxin n=1 Tax=Lonepinella sp. BR2271 TaxID=3434550 RepID=UPI003F6DFE95
MATVRKIVNGVVFEWDSDKEKLVFNQHDIHFEECITVFNDVNCVTVEDNRFKYDENRYITIGLSVKARLLVVAWAERENHIRLITAIKADKRYEQKYRNR